jgi:hypothetical protein
VRRSFLIAELVLATVVVVGVFVQVYLIASFFFEAGDGAKDAHATVGNVIVQPAEIFVLLASFGAWWRRWGAIALSASLAVVGTAQFLLAGGDGWVGGLHGLGAMVVLVLGTLIAHRDARALRALGRGEAPPSEAV